MAPRIHKLTIKQAALEAHDNYTVYELFNDFRRYLVANRFISNFYVYFYEAKIVLTPTGTYYPYLIKGVLIGALKG